MSTIGLLKYLNAFQSLCFNSLIRHHLSLYTSGAAQTTQIPFTSILLSFVSQKLDKAALKKIISVKAAAQQQPLEEITWL